MDLETDNPEKGELLQRSAHHRELLEDELKAITEKSERVITNALIIGAALAAAYFLVSSFSGSSGKERPKGKKSRHAPVAEESETAAEDVDRSEKPGVVAQLGNVLVAQATGLLLSIAREKLVEFLQSQAAKKDNHHEHS